jgi:hypothetical protein
MNSVHVYVAAPYLDARAVRALHAALRASGIQPTSHWAEAAEGPERLDALPVADVRAIARKNDDDLLSAHALIALLREGAGAEMFAEVRLALDNGIPVVWVGARRPLSAYREGVLRVGRVEEAFALVQSFAEIVSRPWLVCADWARSMIWSSIEQLEKGGGAHAAA